MPELRAACLAKLVGLADLSGEELAARNRQLDAIGAEYTKAARELLILRTGLMPTKTPVKGEGKSYRKSSSNPDDPLR